MKLIFAQPQACGRAINGKLVMAIVNAKRLRIDPTEIDFNAPQAASSAIRPE